MESVQQKARVYRVDKLYLGMMCQGLSVAILQAGTMGEGQWYLLERSTQTEWRVHLFRSDGNIPTEPEVLEVKGKGYAIKKGNRWRDVPNIQAVFWLLGPDLKSLPNWHSAEENSIPLPVRKKAEAAVGILQ